MKRSVLVLALMLGLAKAAHGQTTFEGEWKTTFGRMVLTQKGKNVTGHYDMDGDHCTLDGTLDKQRLNFTYREPDAHGEGWFELSADGKAFTGKWRETGSKEWQDWTGSRIAAAEPTYHGLWQTTFGRMRLNLDGNKVEGIYNYGAGARLSGTLDKRRLTFRYKETSAAGEGWFELGDDGKSFKGKWKSDADKGWQDWTGTRVEPRDGVVWLVVVEANWERDLADSEYAFGQMLRAFFARSPRVQVRHRFFRDEAGLKKWCGEVAYLAEPAVLVLATHGSEQGVTVEDQVVGARALADSLKYASNLQLLHFSSCCVMKGPLAHDLHKALTGGAAFPISGYRTEVDWAASAIIEFLYFDLILSRKMTATKAAEQVGKLLPVSGDKAIPGAALRPAEFRLVEPPRGR